MTTNDYEWLQVTKIFYESVYKWLRVTMSDHKWPNFDYEWLRVRLQVTTSEYKWLRVVKSQDGIRIKLYYDSRIILF